MREHTEVASYSRTYRSSLSCYAASSRHFQSHHFSGSPRSVPLAAADGGGIGGCTGGRDATARPHPLQPPLLRHPELQGQSPQLNPPPLPQVSSPAPRLAHLLTAITAMFIRAGASGLLAGLRHHVPWPGEAVSSHLIYHRRQSLA